MYFQQEIRAKIKYLAGPETSKTGTKQTPSEHEKDDTHTELLVCIRTSLTCQPSEQSSSKKLGIYTKEVKK